MAVNPCRARARANRDTGSLGAVADKHRPIIIAVKRGRVIHIHIVKRDGVERITTEHGASRCRKTGGAIPASHQIDVAARII